MRKIQLILLATLACMAFNSTAQTPEKKARAIVFKFTETWCGPCGSWGWQTAEETIAQLGDKGYYIGVMGSSSPASMNANCHSAFANNYNIPGYPSFVIKEDINSQTSGQVMSLVNAFAATTPLASPAATVSISGTTLNVSAKAKFWAAASGEYYLTAFVVEDSVMATQNGQSGTVAHHHIMRGSMAANASPWGQMIATGSVAANAEYTQSFSMPVNTAWNKAKLEVYVVIFKKNGTKYEFVNAAKAQSGNTTAIAGIEGLDALQLFPNPSRGITQVQATLKESRSLDLKVTDALGRVVYSAGMLKMKAGDNTISIPSQNFANGVYLVSLTADNGERSTQRLLIAK